MSQAIFIYGAGGFAREVAWLVDCDREAPFQILGFIDDSGKKSEQWPDSRPVMSYEQARGIAPDAGIVVAIGNPVVRQRISERLHANNVSQPTLKHHALEISERVALGEGCVLCSGSSLTVDITIGAGVHVNLNCTIGHDVVIGDFCTLSPGVHVSGCVTIGKNVFIGTGASILNGTFDKPLTIGDGCVIAAGACLTKSAEAHTLYAGVPAIAKKHL